MLGSKEALAGMMEWSEPVVFDCLNEAYSHRVDNQTRACALARRHAQQWRALIAGEADRFEELRREFLAELGAESLDNGCLVEADVRVLAELYEIAMARFGRRARVADAYRQALREIAAKLAPTGKRAAA
ncbi:MAG: hypothetical protein E7774_00390 [Bradyrhizobium sp.]|nr:MAG: hypothetical protein E7774_00390 [Bradyrhizobium sp.]